MLSPRFFGGRQIRNRDASSNRRKSPLNVHENSCTRLLPASCNRIGLRDLLVHARRGQRVSAAEAEARQVPRRRSLRARVAREVVQPAKIDGRDTGRVVVIGAHLVACLILIHSQRITATLDGKADILWWLHSSLWAFVGIRWLIN